MKCDRCFYCCHIGEGIYADFPVKYCRHTKTYKLPFIVYHEKGKLVKRQLDLDKMEDCKIWAETGCNIHPNTVKKVIRKYFKEAKDGNT